MDFTKVLGFSQLEKIYTINAVFRYKFYAVISLFYIFFLSTAFFLAGSETVFADNNTNKILNQPEYRAGEILIKYKNSPEIEKIFLKSGENHQSVIARYLKQPEIEFAELNYLYRTALIPSDTYYENQWYLGKIKAAEAWDIVRESPQIVIAVVDSGVQIGHPDLKDNIWKNSKEIPDNNIDDDKNGFIDDYYGWDFVNNVPDPSPKFNSNFTEEGILHGTIIAGVAAAAGNNAAGISGLSWSARIMPLKVLDDKGEGDTKNVVKAIDYAIANGADIINFSFVGFGFSQSLESAVRRAFQSGIILVAAAGNEISNGEGFDLDTTPMYPACHDGSLGENMVLGVAATDALDQKALFSSFGSRCVDISAPGVSVFSTTVYSPQNKINGQSFNKFYDGYWSGTSMATPLVSSALALIESANLGLSRNEIIGLLLNNADNINRLNPKYIGRLGSGRLNIYKSVSAAKAELDNHNLKLIIAPNKQSGFLAIISEPHGKKITEIAFPSATSSDGLNFAAGDLDGNGLEEIVGGPNGGSEPLITVMGDGGDITAQFYAYHRSFRGGVHVAVGDVDGDGLSEIVTGAGYGGGPQIRIFDARGRVKGQFFAYDKNFRGGVHVAVANISGGTREGRAEIITAPGKGGGPHIIVYNQQAQILSQFFAYGQNFTGGVNIAGGDIDADGLDEIITGAGPGGAPHVRIFEKNGLIIHSFYAFSESYNGGITVSSAYMDKIY
ncbi:MAG: S8 family serine peptidase [Planctomycetes bacterium]|jgi:hypothetical protein|nr:S8 family serine peptidase [Planctomycetota bacterium]